MTVRGQKAPSAKMCIKTCHGEPPLFTSSVVRKHRAPKGALRQPEQGKQDSDDHTSQKAPSTKRCIKTDVKVLLSS